MSWGSTRAVSRLQRMQLRGLCMQLARAGGSGRKPGGHGERSGILAACSPSVLSSPAGPVGGRH